MIAAIYARKSTEQATVQIETSGSVDRGQDEAGEGPDRASLSKGSPIWAKVGRLRFDEAATDMLTDYQVNGKKSHDNLRHTIIEGALEPWFRGRRMASLTTADIRAYVADRQGKGYAITAVRNLNPRVS